MYARILHMNGDITYQRINSNDIIKKLTDNVNIIGGYIKVEFGKTKKQLEEGIKPILPFYTLKRLT